MKIPIIVGLPIHLWLGVILLLLIIFQIMVAKRIIPVPFQYHRIMGYVILIIAILHGFIAAGLNFGIFSI